jgi:predicted dehydrogenase
MSQPVNTAVVGCGYWGPNLIRNLRSLPGCRLVAVCDRDAKRLAHMKALYPEVATTAEYQDLVQDPALEAIVIATPVHLHHEMARAALAAGKHVMIEKPMARSSRECDDLCGLARRKRRTLMVGHTFLYSAPVRKMKEIIAAGDLGELHYISARRLNLGLFQRDINVTWDLAPHDLSIILYLMGARPVAVNCQGSHHVDPKVEDVTNLQLYFARGDYATIHSSWLDPRKVRDMTVVGSRRMIVYDDLEPLQKLTIYDVHVERPPHYDTFAEFHYAYHYGDMYSPYLKQDEPLKVQCQHFLECIAGGTTPMTPGEQGGELVRILEAASLSLQREGARVRMDEVDRRRARRKA